MVNEKDIISISAGALIDLYGREMDRVSGGMRCDSNLKAQFDKCAFMVALLQTVSRETLITVEGCRGDKLIRDFCLTNSGSVVECLVKVHLQGLKSAEKTWNDEDADIFQGIMPWEVKASLGRKYLATPSNKELTLLVNLDGISLIRKDEVLSCCIDKKKGGKIKKVLPEHGIYGNRKHPWLIKLQESMNYKTVEC